jgi:nicotinate-nucleotide adenylyltransferase
MNLSAQIKNAAIINQDKQKMLIREYQEVIQARSAYRLGIMGGTFDPIHYGHLLTAETVRSGLNLNKVLFIPSGRPPHKQERDITDSEHRYQMTLLATANNPQFIASRLEIDRPGYSYAVDTVKQVYQKIGPRVDLFFITGADAVLEISTWRDVLELLELCTFVAATRPGFDLIDLKLDLYLPLELINNIQFIEVPMLAISATDIRNRVRHGKSFRYLLPEIVEKYIEKCCLYQDLGY